MIGSIQNRLEARMNGDFLFGSNSIIKKMKNQLNEKKKLNKKNQEEAEHKLRRKVKDNLKNKFRDNIVTILSYRI